MLAAPTSTVSWRVNVRQVGWGQLSSTSPTPTIKPSDPTESLHPFRTRGQPLPPQKRARRPTHKHCHPGQRHRPRAPDTEGGGATSVYCVSCPFASGLHGLPWQQQIYLQGPSGWNFFLTFHPTKLPRLYPTRLPVFLLSGVIVVSSLVVSVALRV